MTSATPYVRIVEDSGLLVEMLGVMLDRRNIRYCSTSSRFGFLLTPAVWEGITTVLCDLDLGDEITGEMVLKYLQEHHPSIKRIVLSGAAQVSNPHLISLADVILVKPADITVMTEAIQ